MNAGDTRQVSMENVFEGLELLMESSICYQVCVQLRMITGVKETKDLPEFVKNMSTNVTDLASKDDLLSTLQHLSSVSTNIESAKEEADDAASAADSAKDMLREAGDDCDEVKNKVQEWYDKVDKPVEKNNSPSESVMSIH